MPLKDVKSIKEKVAQLFVRPKPVPPTAELNKAALTLEQVKAKDERDKQHQELAARLTAEKTAARLKILEQPKMDYKPPGMDGPPSKKELEERLAKSDRAIEEKGRPEAEVINRKSEQQILIEAKQREERQKAEKPEAAKPQQGKVSGQDEARDDGPLTTREPTAADIAEIENLTEAHDAESATSDRDAAIAAMWQHRHDSQQQDHEHDPGGGRELDPP